MCNTPRVSLQTNKQNAGDRSRPLVPIRTIYSRDVEREKRTYSIWWPFFYFFDLRILPSACLTMRERSCFSRINLYRSKSPREARLEALARPVAMSVLAQAASMPAEAHAFLTVPGRAPWQILIDKSVNLILLTLTVLRLQLPSSNKSLLKSMTLTIAIGFFNSGTKTTPPI